MTWRPVTWNVNITEVDVDIIYLKWAWRGRDCAAEMPRMTKTVFFPGSKGLGFEPRSLQTKWVDWLENFTILKDYRINPRYSNSNKIEMFQVISCILVVCLNITATRQWASADTFDLIAIVQNVDFRWFIPSFLTSAVVWLNTVFLQVSALCAAAASGLTPTSGAESRPLNSALMHYKKIK